MQLVPHQTFVKSVQQALTHLRGAKRNQTLFARLARQGPKVGPFVRCVLRASTKQTRGL